MTSNPKLFKKYGSAFASVSIIAIAILIFGADTSVSAFLISFLILLISAVLIWRSPEMYPDRTVLLMLGAWIAFVVIQSSKGHITGASDQYLILLCAIFIFWQGEYAIEGGGRPKVVWNFVLALGLAFSIFAVFQHILSPDQIFGLERPSHTGRLSGTFLSSNTAATFLGMIVLASIAQIHRIWLITMTKSQIRQSMILVKFFQASIFSVATFLFSVSALLMTKSHAGIVLTVCVSLLFSFWVIVSKRQRGNVRKLSVQGRELAWIFTCCFFVLVVWQMSGGSFDQRFERLFVDYAFRDELISASWRTFQYQPIWGHGLGHFQDAKLLGVDPVTNMYVMKQNASHSFYLQTLVQSGIAGLLTISAIYILIFGTLLKALTQNKPFRTYIAAALLMSLLICFHGLFDNALEIPAVMLFHAWILGIGYGVQKKYQV